jgi:hypothetical protein
MGEADTSLPQTGQAMVVDTELSSSSESEDRMERQPEVRQLVVLRTSLSGENELSEGLETKIQSDFPISQGSRPIRSPRGSLSTRTFP